MLCQTGSREAVRVCAVEETPQLAAVSRGRARRSAREAQTVILSWQPFVRAARHGNVAFATGGSYKVRAQCDCHNPSPGPNICDKATQSAPRNHQVCVVWPFLCRIGLFLLPVKYQFPQRYCWSCRPLSWHRRSFTDSLRKLLRRWMSRITNSEFSLRPHTVWTASNM